MTGGCGHIWDSTGSFSMYCQCCLSMCDSGERSGLYGMTNGRVRWLVVGVVVVSSWDCVNDEALLI